jgi:broad specificity phosphatase PhoE
LLLLLLALLLLRPVTAAQSACRRENAFRQINAQRAAGRVCTALPLSLCALLVEPSPVPRCKWPPLWVGQRAALSAWVHGLRATAEPQSGIMRLLLIRHGETGGNANMQRAIAELEREKGKGNFTQKELNKRIRIDPSAEDGDTKLTALGESQAEALGEHWAPLLEAKAAAGDLHVFVSPMIRCCQTVDPLMRRLRRTLPDFTAQLKMNIWELPGLMHNDDWALFDEIDELVATGTPEARKAVGNLLKTKEWTPCGMSAQNARESFAWATTPPEFPEASPWYTQGFESPKRTAARIKGVVAEIHAQKTELPEEAVVVFVSHGGTINELINHLLLQDDRTVRATIQQRSNAINFLQCNFRGDCVGELTGCNDRCRTCYRSRLKASQTPQVC